MKLLDSLKLFGLGAAMLLSSQAMAADRTVLIGYAAPLTGASGSIGASLVHAAEIAVDDANRQAIHIDGDKLVFKLLTQDDRSDPRTGLLVAEYFVKSGVVGVIGHWNSGVGIPASLIYKNADIVQIAQATTAHAYTEQSFPTTFRIVPHDDEGAGYTAEYVVRQMKSQRIAIIDDQTPFGAGYAKHFAQMVTSLKGNIVSQFGVSSRTSDFNAVLRNVQKQNPDVVFFGGLDAQAGQLAKELKRFDINAPLVSVGGTVGAQYLKIAGEAGNGTVALEPGQPSYKGAPWQQFEKTYKSRFGGEMGLYAPFSYDAVQVLVAAIRQANSLDRQRIIAAMHQVRHNGLTGTIAFDAEGNLANPVFTIFQVKDQKWVPLKVIGGKK
ncbi:branched-chain amino acid ABC transporter substrate-binding protein [Herbaspirillum rhizosphaerae]|uniref:branched-chain amino acid ABC transporter substrate-binding protein n=1 Tax=Herbaspirillum rhizosphaerae TaxID=346179 RepID=UPI00067E335B|nr:branched-chain amino acid ABC transporter substrate-binding protein [Herbaspirillum rhizosphaerae]